MSGASPPGPRGPAAGRSRRRRRAVAAALAAGVALVLAAVLTGPPGEDGPALDPRSTGDDGLRGLVDLAEAMGTDIDISPDLPGDTSVHLFVARDVLGDAARSRIGEWVAQGGRLVVADPTSPLHELEAGSSPVTDLVGPSGRAPECPLTALEEVAWVSHAGWGSYRVPDDATGCFPGGDGEAWLVAREVGEGHVIALGSPASLVNRSLARDDNAVLAAALLFPAPESRLQILPPDRAALAEGLGVDDASVAEEVRALLPERLGGALALLGLAAGLLLLAVGRRLGRPVEERLPPTVPSAELARSVGDLLQRAGSRQGAAARLRAGAREEVARVLATGERDPARLAEQARRRLHLDAEVARRALLDLPVDDDAELVEVARAAAEVREHLTAAS